LPILADETAIEQMWLRLISQAEHDVIAAAVLVTTSTELASAVKLELEKRVAATNT
jgi:histidinol dehydrogenase